MMTAYGSVDAAVEAMKQGAYDCVTKDVYKRQGKTDFSHFTKSRVRLLGRTGHYLETNTAALRAAMKSA